MFTGIVEEVGEVIDVKIQDFDRDFIIKQPRLSTSLMINDSVAVNGVCLTVREKFDDSFLVSAAFKTLELTNLSNLKLGSFVNLEASLTLMKPIGGHLVQGHVADVSIILDEKRTGEAIYFKFSKPNQLNDFIVSKGYIAVDGMSVTVCQEGEDWFEVMIIPHTLEVTIAKYYQISSKVNIEVDIFARYIEKMHGVRQ